VLLATLRDLQWRARRFVIAGTGASVVFALTLVLSGLSASFTQEAGRVVDAMGADAWVVQHGVEGVFTAASLVPETALRQVAAAPGVRQAYPVAVVHSTVDAGTAKDVSVIGFAPRALGTPVLSAGRLPRSVDEVVADRSLRAGVGSSLVLGGRRVTVVGQTRGLTALGGQSLVFMRLADAQARFFQGQPLISAVLTKGVPADVGPALSVRTRQQTKDDLLRPIVGAITSIRVTLLLLWAVAAMVVGSVVYLSALERRQDFAVYKATGWSTRDLALGLALQAALLSTAAAVVGLVLAQLMIPLFPLTFSVPGSARLLLPVVGLVVGLLASGAGLRKAVGVDPATAFGGP
jgi:putative ABC transport system permease protein